MSKDKVARFLSRTGEAEGEAVKRVVAGSDDLADIVDAIVSVASNQGDDFTAEEFVEVMTSIQSHLAGELSSEELEGVAGGGGLPQAHGVMRGFSPQRVMTAAEEIFRAAGAPPK